MSRRSPLYQAADGQDCPSGSCQAHAPSYQERQIQSWHQHIHHALPNLSVPQARTLALWSIGIVLSGTCSLTAITFALSQWCRQPPNTLRQRLREFYLDAGHKRGPGRTDLCPAVCFAGLLAWIVATLRPCKTDPRATKPASLALALDATHFQDRFIVLCISVLYRGSAIPVAWTILPAQQKQPWLPHWQRMLTALAPSVPSQWRVLVLADRGLYRRGLFIHIVKQGWHPLLRVQKNGTFCPQGAHALPLPCFVPPGGGVFRAKGVAFQGQARLACTLIAYHAPASPAP